MRGEKTQIGSYFPVKHFVVSPPRGVEKKLNADAQVQPFLCGLYVQLLDSEYKPYRIKHEEQKNKSRTLPPAEGEVPAPPNSV